MISQNIYYQVTQKLYFKLVVWSAICKKLLLVVAINGLIHGLSLSFGNPYTIYQTSYLIKITTKLTTYTYLMYHVIYSNK